MLENLYEKKKLNFKKKNLKSNLILKKLLLIIINFHKNIATYSSWSSQSNPATKNSTQIIRTQTHNQ